MAKILITGTAGFIGFHLAKKLINEGFEVVGLDNINNYYSQKLKFDRLEQTGIISGKIVYNQSITSEIYSNYKFIQLNLSDKTRLFELFKNEKFDFVCNLAAQAGVRHSLTHPEDYVESNLVGFVNILEASRHFSIKHLVYASSSSVYGLNTNMPFDVKHAVDHPASLYAATKKSNELMAHSYSHLFNIPTTGLRFFSVYGPWGRPDMALFLFTEAILSNKPINVYNNGDMKRDFTYVDDIVDGVSKVIKTPPTGNREWSGLEPDSSCSSAPYKIYNIGNNNTVKLLDFIEEIELNLGKKAQKNYLPLQKGDIPVSFADVSALEKDFNYKPNTSVQTGIKNFIDWYLDYFKK
jgi:UDP-glucuronate 4-epimerase